MARTDTVEVVSDRARVTALVPEWEALHRESGSRNPFAHPAWIRAWLDHYGGAHELRLTALRRSGQLVAVAPLVRRQIGRGPLRAAALQLIGSFGPEPFTELPEVLARPCDRRMATAAIVRHFVQQQRDWDWLEIALVPGCWPESSWVPAGWGARGGALVHASTRAFVVLPLPPAPALLSGVLKRNMREALRRAENRLAALREPVAVEVHHDPHALAAPLSRLIDLHQARARLGGGVPHHVDWFEAPGAKAFAGDAVPALAAAGLARVAELRAGERVLAGRLILSSGDGIFLSCSGLDPGGWRLCAATALQRAVLQQAIEAGAGWANLSLNPDQAKLRWSERLELHHDVILVAPARCSRTLFRLFWQHRLTRELRRPRAVAHAPGEGSWP